MAHDASRSPATPWHEARPPLLGLGAALAFALLAILADSLLAAAGPDPGTLLGWLPLVAAATGFLIALRLRGPLREGALAGSLGLLAVLAALDPTPAAWTYAAAAVAAALTLVLRLQPATRLVAALPVLAGLLVAVARLPPGPAMLALAVAAVAGFLLALCFLVPQASGWRPVPFSVALAASLALPVAMLAMLAASLAVDGVARPNGDLAPAAGPSPWTLASAALALGVPVALVALWRSRAVRRFQLPTVALSGAPHGVQAEPRPAPEAAPENA